MLHNGINKQITSLRCTASSYVLGFNIRLSIIPAEMSTIQPHTAATNIWHIRYMSSLWFTECLLALLVIKYPSKYCNYLELLHFKWTFAEPRSQKWCLLFIHWNSEHNMQIIKHYCILAQENKHTSSAGKREQGRLFVCCQCFQRKRSSFCKCESRLIILWNPSL